MKPAIFALRLLGCISLSIVLLSGARVASAALLPDQPADSYDRSGHKLERSEARARHNVSVPSGNFAPETLNESVKSVHKAFTADGQEIHESVPASSSDGPQQSQGQ